MARFCFPNALEKLDYQDRLPPGAFNPAYINDAWQSLVDYFTQETLGLACQRYLAGRRGPAVVSEQDLAAIRNLRAQGFSSEQGRQLIGLSLEELPGDVDLDRAPPPVLDRLVHLLTEISLHDGFSIANTTKLAHLLRPRLVPMLDQPTRQALGLAWLRGGNHERGPNSRCFAQGLRMTKEVFDWHNNRRILLEIREKLASHAMLLGLAISDVRVVDVLAWRMCRYPGHPS